MNRGIRLGKDRTTMSEMPFKPKEIQQLARRWHKKQVAWRRHLHQYPEIANQETNTTAFLKKELHQIGLKILPLKLKTGVLAEVKGKQPGPTVAIRSDIDALPLQEETGVSYASKNFGRMHACGHDVHMATMLGVAAALAEWRDKLTGNVRFIFQPAEEDPPGGARFMIEQGALDNVDTIFGMHVDPHLKVGRIGLCDGPMMAMVYDFDLIIKGRGGHAARPQFSVDAIIVACEVVDTLQTLVSRYSDPSDPLVLTFGQIEGGTARNVIADRVRLVGTARTLSPAFGKKIPGLIRKITGGVCRAHGANFEMTEAPAYPIMINDPSTNARYAEVFRFLFGCRGVKSVEAILGGEDFAYYLQEVPGAMLRLGIRNKKIGADKPWHSSKFMVDEEAIYYATALMVGSTMKYFAENL